jgi:hypothetical protein
LNLVEKKGLHSVLAKLLSFLHEFVLNVYNLMFLNVNFE